MTRSSSTVNPVRVDEIDAKNRAEIGDLSSRVAHALRARHQDDDIRDLLAHVTTPVLHLVHPDAIAHDRGHDVYLQSHLPDITTIELTARDELW